MSKIFKSRTTAPTKSNKYYYKNNVFYKMGYGLPNCTCYAWGRSYELTGSKPKLSTYNAEDWYNYNDGYKRGKTPKLGAVACWRKGKTGTSSDGAGHVAIVERTYSDGSILISESGHNSFLFRTYKLNKNYKYFTGYTFQGFIYQPVEFTTKSTNTSYTLGYYKTKNTVNVRSGPGTNYRIKKVRELTTDGKKHATSKNSNASAIYKKNTSLKITSIISGSNNSIWGKCPSGYVCLKDKNGTYCTKTSTDSSYTLGNYQTNMSMNIREGAGTNFAIKKVSKMTSSGKKNAVNQNENAYATYKKGTKFTASELIKNSSGNYWLKSPSGYVCLKDSKTTYCKKN